MSVAFALGALPVVAATPAGSAPVSWAFSFTGAPQTYTVPAGITSVEVVTCGAQGGQFDAAGFAVAPGGLGGRAMGTLAVTPGEQLTVHVGGEGSNNFEGVAGGWNGGGDGSASGGGASDVRQGGTSLADRVAIGGGGGGAGMEVANAALEPLPGGAGGGLTGGGLYPGTQSGPGVDPEEPGRNGALGAGGNGTPVSIGVSNGGGGGLYGGAAGGFVDPLTYLPGSGGSGLGDSHEPGVCEGNGSVTITYDDGRPLILPLGAAGYEADTTWQIPVRLSAPSAEIVTVDWSTGTLPNDPGMAQAGTDFVAASGTITFDPGETEVLIPIEILDDADDEQPLLWGEWGVIEFTNPTNAALDTGPFFGRGLIIIFDDD